MSPRGKYICAPWLNDENTLVLFLDWVHQSIRLCPRENGLKSLVLVVENDIEVTCLARSFAKHLYFKGVVDSDTLLECQRVDYAAFSCSLKSSLFSPTFLFRGARGAHSLLGRLQREDEVEDFDVDSVFSIDSTRATSSSSDIHPS